MLFIKGFTVDNVWGVISGEISLLSRERRDLQSVFYLKHVEKEEWKEEEEEKLSGRRFVIETSFNKRKTKMFPCCVPSSF